MDPDLLGLNRFKTLDKNIIVVGEEELGLLENVEEVVILNQGQESGFPVRVFEDDGLQQVREGQVTQLDQVFVLEEFLESVLLKGLIVI